MARSLLRLVLGGDDDRAFIPRLNADSLEDVSLVNPDKAFCALDHSRNRHTEYH